jgi:hypothetical protein
VPDLAVRRVGEEDPGHPDVSLATLEIDGRRVYPFRVAPAYPLEFRRGDLRIVRDGGRLVATDARTDGEAWSVVVPDGRELKWAGLGGGIAHFVSDEPAPPRVMRLDTATGRWLPGLDLGPAADASLGGTFAGIDDTAVDADRVFVLWARVPDSPKDPTETGWLGCFRTQTGERVWARKLDPSEEPERKGYARRSRHRKLAAVGDRVLSATERRLSSFDAASGREVWRADGIGEYQLGFTGPSTNRSEISRFALSDDDDAEAVRTARREFDERYSAVIVDGPAVRRHRHDRGSEGDVYVVVRRERVKTEAFLFGAAEAFIYVFREPPEPWDGPGVRRLRPAAMVRLPRMVFIAAVTREGVACFGEGGAVLNLDWPYPVNRFEPNQSQIRIAWYFEDGWRPDTAVAVSGRFAVCLDGQGDARDEAFARFHLVRIDLLNGSAVPIRLTIPSPNPAPADGPGVAVRDLRIETRTLRVTVEATEAGRGARGVRRVVDFDLGDVLSDAARDTGD